jgi:AGZA family xanthine/uracil permease-like MFS transporter
MKQNFWQKMVGFQASKHAVKTEVLAGLTTFITMAYILAVNPEIISATGMDKGAVLQQLRLCRVLLPYLWPCMRNYLWHWLLVWG